MCFAKTINSLHQFDEFKQEIMNAIKALPQNPKMRNLNERNFRVNLRDAADNWSIFYNSNKLQVKAISSLIAEKTDIDSIRSLLKEISEKGYYATSGAHKVYFNKEVRNHIHKILAYKFDLIFSPEVSNM
jgi:hypothetical protein